MPPPRLKRSNTAGQVPASLADGEIAINQADGKLFYQTAAGGVASFSGVPTDGSVTAAKIAGGAVITAGIANSAVTYAKVQNVSATDRVLGRSTAGAGVVEEITCTAFGRSIIDDADASAARATLGLGTMATAAASSYLPLTGGTVSGTFTVSVAAGATLNLTATAGTGQLAETTAGLLYLSNYVTGSQIIYNQVGAGAHRFLVSGIDVGRFDNVGFAVYSSGSAAAPSISVYSDANTGLLFPAADTLAVSTGGVERMRIDSSGKVGIGAASTGAALYVTHASGTGVNSVINAGAGTVNYALMGQATGAGSANTGVYVNALNASTNYGVRIVNPPAAGGNYAIYSDATAQSYFAGSIGVGVTLPTVPIDVAGSTVRIRTARTPASATATGAVGEVCWDATHLYICTATNTWRRIAHATW
jgi:hypothetical protein